MSLYELLDLSISIGTRIDVQLSIFITVHLAIFSGIIYVDRPLRYKEKIGGLFIYSIFAFLNYRIMQHQLDLAESLLSEISRLSDNPCCADNPTVKYLANRYHSGIHNMRELFLVIGHVVFYTIVMLSLLFDKALLKMTGKQA